MASDEIRKLIAPCGAFCGRCPLHLACTDENLRKKMAERQGIPVEQVYVCAGCRQLRGKVKVAGGNPICETYACADEKHVEFCYECAEFPCANFHPCADRARDIQHNMKIYYLLTLQKKGIDVFVEQFPLMSRTYFQGKKAKPGSGPELP